MPERIYRFRYKLATVSVKADNQKRARYVAELAYHHWKTSGIKNYPGATIEVERNS